MITLLPGVGVTFAEPAISALKTAGRMTFSGPVATSAPQAAPTDD